MIKVLNGTFKLTLISLGMAVLFAVLLFIITRRRHWWLRYTAAE